MIAIAVFLVTHWCLSILCQTVFLHRYSAHKMFTMTKPWERAFHLLTAVAMGSSYLVPRPYAILHREHHAYSDREGDPHSPHIYPGLFTMMWQTKRRYEGLRKGTIVPEPRFEGGYPEWPAVDSFFNRWSVSVGFGLAYTAFYFVFAPHWAYFLLLPIHYVMGPIHGAIVNYCGHKYGYRNFETGYSDKSRNTLVVDVVTMGELFQNNHHARPASPNFAARRFELDPAFMVIRFLARLNVIRYANPRVPVAPATAENAAAPS
jgi:stearoyl-CoA desaturase (delta-9 desaturase)